MSWSVRDEIQRIRRGVRAARGDMRDVMPAIERLATGLTEQGVDGWRAAKDRRLVELTGAKPADLAELAADVRSAVRQQERRERLGEAADDPLAAMDRVAKRIRRRR